MNNKARSNRQGSEAITGVTQARQNQQQGQCKGRGRQQTERISQGRQSQKAGSKRSEYIGSPGKHRETEYRENAQKCQPGQEQDLATCVGKCAAYMWVSE